MATDAERPPPRPLDAAALAAVLDTLDSGVLVLDLRLQPLLANEAARRELQDGGLLRRLPDGTLAAADEPSQARLRTAQLAAARGGLRQLLPLHDGQRLRLAALLPLATPAGQSPRSVLLLGRRQLAPDLVVALLGQVYALTEAEQRVLAGLLAGQRVAGLAREHGVQLSTLRTQVAALRSKFGVRRIDELIRLAAELPPMADALRTPL
ncbi:MAG: hypothetical protein KBC73_01035 [Burkholderiaceae bacterium]|nr:hypothetical protein [Burkholderiaceae bacterium]